MGARQSKRSVDITTTPKKEGVPAEGGVVGDAAAPGDGKLERIEETDTKPTTNGIAPHTEAAEDKEKDKDEATEKEKEQPQQQQPQPQQQQQEEVKTEEAKQESIGESPAEVAEVTTPTTEDTPASPNAVASPDSKEAKKKDKKKKWSFRSISFSKKDKTKPSRDETRKNGDVAMDGNMSVQEPLAEGGEEAESATATAGSPADEKSTASSPSADEQQVAAPVASASTTEPKKEETAAASSAAASPAEEKKEEPTPSAPTPVPAEDKKEETVEKVEATEKKVVEVSPAGGRSVADPIEVPVFRVQPVTAPSIIERKTSEDLPSLPPSSPPPTPIDPSPLQQARQAAASATALAEALKLPAVVGAGEEESSTASSSFGAFPLSRDDTYLISQENRAEPAPVLPASVCPRSPVPSAEPPTPTEVTQVPAKLEHLPVVETVVETRDVAREGETLTSTRDNEEIGPRVENAPVSSALTEEVSEKGDERNKVEDQLHVEDTQSQAKCCRLAEKTGSSVGDSVVEKVTDPSDNSPAIESEPRSSEIGQSRQMPMDYSNEKNAAEAPPLTAVRLPEMKVADAATDKVMNETLPAVECPIKCEINNRVGVMKTNVLPNAGHNEKAEAGALASAEIETNSACPTIEQHLSLENFETVKVVGIPSEETRVDSIGKLSDSDLPSVNQCVYIGTEERSEVAKQPCEGSIELERDYAKDVPKEIREEAASASSAISPEQIEPTVIPTVDELFIDSEEGPLSVSDDVLVEAKRAVVIPEDDSVEELTDTTESVKVIPETDEEKIDNGSDTALPTEETLISEELEDMSAPEDAPAVEPLCESLNDTKTVHVEDEPLPLPPVSDADAATCGSQTLELPSTEEAHSSIVAREDPVVVFSTIIEAESVSASPLLIEQTEGIESPPASHEAPLDSLVASESILCEPLGFPKVLTDFLSAEVGGASQSSEPQTLLPPFEGESTTSDYPPVTPDDTTNLLPLRVSPLPHPAEFLPVLDFVEHATSPRDPTETLLTPPVTPHSQSNANIATTTNDYPQTLSNDEDDRDNRVSLSEPDMYDLSDVESDRLAAECPMKTECQEEALSCQLLTAVQPTAVQEHHQSSPEAEAPVENNVAHESSTTESVNEAPKVAPPAVPTEAPASPPTAPAITEDVASVTKAIEEIDISDKAVAAAVNEAIECNTNEIIADAHHQNNINEYE